ncbi:hypothetical protein FOCC_FOCC004811 [Frankliniella occidentalis]|nr:hypothetical protein FOCC_FOCC004811 [Frankliniella occidentalis]
MQHQKGFVEANARCFWSAALLEAMRELSFEGYVSPGVLLVRAGACAIDVVRAAWARRVLKPPPNYLIEDVGCSAYDLWSAWIASGSEGYDYDRYTIASGYAEYGVDKLGSYWMDNARWMGRDEGVFMDTSETGRR